MGRRYRVTFENIAVAAPQDLLQIKGATGKMLKVLRTWWGNTDTTVPTAQNLSTRCRFLPATVTDGSGGSTSTPQPLDPGDAAASFTCKINNTTKATTGGTASIVDECGDHISAGSDRPQATMVGPSESFVFELLSTPSGTVHISGGAEVEEMGG